jgi:hypothetical protein
VLLLLLLLLLRSSSCKSGKRLGGVLQQPAAQSGIADTQSRGTAPAPQQQQPLPKQPQPKNKLSREQQLLAVAAAARYVGVQTSRSRRRYHAWVYVSKPGEMLRQHDVSQQTRSALAELVCVGVCADWLSLLNNSSTVLSTACKYCYTSDLLNAYHCHATYNTYLTFQRHVCAAAAPAAAAAASASCTFQRHLQAGQQGRSSI